MQPRAAQPRALAVVGWSGSGKTTLIEALIPCFTARGFTVSTVKHAHHRLALDQPGKDSARHAAAGAREVLLVGGAGYALFGPGPPPLAALLDRLAPVDLVLVEGYKSMPFPKLEVYRPALGKPPLWPETDVLAVASDTALPHCPVPVLDLAAPREIAGFLIRHLGLDDCGQVTE